MKKLYSFILLLGLVLLLAACGSDQASDTTAQNSEDTNELQEQTNEKTEDSETSHLTTEQKMEVYEHTEDEFGDYFLLGAYTNKAGDGEYEPISATFDNFIITAAPYLVEIDLNEEAKELEQFSGKDTVRAIMLETESENENDYNFTYYGKATAVTDTGEELTGLIGPDSELVKDYTTDEYGEYGYIYFILEDAGSKPKQLEITFEPPVRDGEPVGEAQTVTPGELISEENLDI
ncbi:hypothetical protein SAMN05421663_1077 [Terribacillus halophilus]|uniref:Lipoprotein n=1 Tax=Terribacillus halophilus TaxID=361279 RepID=A0A1G6S7F5_9BACI|nr:hypothetical protein [Terribacillus halophilus]SDD12852.1 hypothetical protein SAMN05421663_1077 [Terribacillus halophilus]